MEIKMSGELIRSMLNLARELHPKEVILLLRGKVSRSEIYIDDILLPPFASAGINFAQFPPHMLPIDFSIVGTAHSHPSGLPAPSAADLKQFYSRVMVILAYPYIESSVKAYNSRREPLPRARVRLREGGRKVHPRILDTERESHAREPQEIW